MRERLMDLIGCPDCGADLDLDAQARDGDDILTGRLSCSACPGSWPILRGIPRFLDDIRSEEDLRRVYADSFGHQWTTYDWVREEDEYEFFAITDLTPADLEGKLVLDAGCGGGRFARVVAPKVGEYVGFDFSIAVDKARELCKDNPDAHFVQCDVNRHPFKDGLFELVYSHGVLHHTPDTKRSFDNLPRLLAPGGTFYVALFRKAVLPLRLSDGLWRSILNKAPIWMMDRICGALSHLYKLPNPVFFKRFFWFSLQPTKELRKCCLYDWYAPRYHHEHSVEEVMGWYHEHGLRNVAYINAWPYAPADEKYRIPRLRDNVRLGLLLGMIGQRPPATEPLERRDPVLAVAV